MKQDVDDERDCLSIAATAAVDCFGNSHDLSLSFLLRFEFRYSSC